MQQRKQTLTEFWAAFKGFHSSHEVHTTESDYLDGVVPLLWHGARCSQGDDDAVHNRNTVWVGCFQR